MKVRLFDVKNDFIGSVELSRVTAPRVLHTNEGEVGVDRFFLCNPGTDTYTEVLDQEFAQIDVPYRPNPA